jgi:hypothetical protein
MKVLWTKSFRNRDKKKVTERNNEKNLQIVGKQLNVVAVLL